ncbi:MAG: YeaC family protein [Pseudomonadales bacterium]|nr:YeaC family protein [Pseudomonadales bacterium]
MDFDAMIQSITPEVYENLKRAVELGKWADGTPLTQEQKETCMQAVIAYGLQNKAEEDRVGYIDRGTKDEGEMCDDNDASKDKPIKFLDS